MPDFDQNHFDHFLPKKPMFRAQEVADLLSISDTTVEKLIDGGQLSCHRFNGGEGKRFSHRIPRPGIVSFLLKTKNYAVKDYLSGIVCLLRNLSEKELACVSAEMPDLMVRAKVRSAAISPFRR